MLGCQIQAALYVLPVELIESNSAEWRKNMQPAIRFIDAKCAHISIGRDLISEPIRDERRDRALRRMNRLVGFLARHEVYDSSTTSRLVSRITHLRICFPF
jgi:hypothetical protein